MEIASSGGQSYIEALQAAAELIREDKRIMLVILISRPLRNHRLPQKKRPAHRPVQGSELF
jgi:hypothetical protein